MPSPLSVDLRTRVVAAILDGASCHQAAARFRVSVASASRWSTRHQLEGHVTPKPSGGDRNAHRTEAHADLILTTYEQRPEIFLHQLRGELARQGVETTTSSLSRFFARHGITRKKGQPTQLSKSERT